MKYCVILYILPSFKNRYSIFIEKLSHRYNHKLRKKFLTFEMYPALCNIGLESKNKIADFYYFYFKGIIYIVISFHQLHLQACDMKKYLFY